jgi:hypothetical protein
VCRITCLHATHRQIGGMILMMTNARMMSIDKLKASRASSILRGMMVSPLDGNGACGRRDCGLPLGGRNGTCTDTSRADAPGRDASGGVSQADGDYVAGTGRSYPRSLSACERADQQATRYHPQHGATLGPSFWKLALVLDESPASVEPFSGPADRGHRAPAHSACAYHRLV